MKIFSRIKAFVQAQKRSFDDMHDWQLALLGAGGALPALYWASKLTVITPQLTRITDQYGLNWLGIGCWVCVGLIAIQTWYLGVIAKRCGEILAKRMFG